MIRYDNKNVGKEVKIRQMFGRIKMTLFYMSSAVLWIGLALLSTDIHPAYGIDISDTPLSAQLDASPPNVMFGLDDSGSMDWETLTEQGVYHINGGGTGYEYIFNSGDNLYGTGSGNGTILTGDNRKFYRSQWYGYNRMYYNPNVTYNPWHDSKDDATGITYSYSADPDRPRSHPFNSTPTLRLADPNNNYLSCYGVNIANSHYYVKDGNNVYLVNLPGENGNYQKNYYLASITNNYVTNLQSVGTPAIDSGRSAADERQNFANWYSFYRKRMLTALSVIGELIPELSGMQVGIRGINGYIKRAVWPIDVNGVDKTDELRHIVYSFYQNHSAGTPLRLGLKKIGQYYNTSDNPGESMFSTSPLDSGEGGACQQNFCIIFTDGYWNGNDPGVGNCDNSTYTIADSSGDHVEAARAPYKDGYSNTLADVAYRYWVMDLDHDSTNNIVPIKNPPDPANWQHMVTYTVSFGVDGELDPDDYVLYCTNPGDCVYPTWPGTGNGARKVTDLWHAAVNGRGKFLSAKNPEELLAAFADIISDVVARDSTAASVTLNGDKLQNGLTLYQTRYNAEGWIGYFYAFGINETTGLIENADGQDIFDAGDTLDTDTVWSERKIVSYSGTAGIPFDKGSMDAGQWQRFDSDAAEAEDIINYLRGDRSNEGTYRMRESVLGDIVHSAPVWHNNAVYVGANDGMLHVFKASDPPLPGDGYEIFAYVPNLVTSHLAELTDIGYSHKFFVDQPVFIRDRVGGGSNPISMLIGGLGKGGKGYYALDVTDVNNITTITDATDRVLWEYPNPPGSDPDMGYSFGTAYPVKTNDGGWKVIFANGYNSLNGKAILYITDLDGGNVMKIDTEVGGDNGLSSPNVTYGDSNETIDYVYAGDLKGNMWKFDLTSTNPAEWDVAYKFNGTKMPVFTATDETGATQPITVRPGVISHCQDGFPGYMVVFATGKYLAGSDLSSGQTQSVYGVWDFGDDLDDEEFLGTYDRVTKRFSGPRLNMFSTLVEQTIIEVVNTGHDIVRAISANDAKYITQPDGVSSQKPDPSQSKDNNVGWFIDLPTTKEKVHQDPIVSGGLAYFISFIPETASACETGGDSWLWEINACSGSRYYKPVFDTNNDDIIDRNDVVEVNETGAPGSPNYDPNATVLLPASAVHFDQGTYMPAMVLTPGQKLKYMSTADGGSIMKRNISTPVGMIYWKEN